MKDEKRTEYMQKINDGVPLHNLPEEAQQDREIVLAGVKRFYANFINLPENSVFFDDEEIVLAAFDSFLPKIRRYRTDGSPLKYASNRLKASTVFVAKCVSKYGLALEHAPLECQDDVDIVYRACQAGRTSAIISDYPLAHASERLKQNEDFLLRLIENISEDEKYLLEFSPKALTENQAFMAKVALLNVDTFERYISKNETLRNKIISDSIATDQKILRKLVDKNSSLLASYFEEDAVVSNDIGKDQTILAILKEKKSPLLKDYFRNVTKDFKYDESLVREVLEINGECLEFFKDFQNNSEVVATAVKNNGKAFKFAPKNLQENKTIIIQAIKTYPQLLEALDHNLPEDIINASKIKESSARIAECERLLDQYRSRRKNARNKAVTQETQWQAVKTPEQAVNTSEQAVNNPEQVVEALQEMITDKVTDEKHPLKVGVIAGVSLFKSLTGKDIKVKNQKKRVPETVAKIWVELNKNYGAEKKLQNIKGILKEKRESRTTRDRGTIDFYQEIEAIIDNNTSSQRLKP